MSNIKRIETLKPNKEYTYICPCCQEKLITADKLVIRSYQEDENSKSIIDIENNGLILMKQL